MNTVILGALGESKPFSLIKSSILLTLLGQLPDLFLVWLVVRFFDPFYDWTNIFWGYLAFKAALLFVWLVRSTFSWAFFLIHWKTMRTITYLELLRSNKMPIPDEYEADSPQAYFNRVATDDAATKDVQLFAAVTWGELQGYRSMGQLSSLLMTTIPLKKALRAYREGSV